MKTNHWVQYTASQILLLGEPFEHTSAQCLYNGATGSPVIQTHSLLIIGTTTQPQDHQLPKALIYKDVIFNTEPL